MGAHLSRTVWSPIARTVLPFSARGLEKSGETGKQNTRQQKQKLSEYARLFFSPRT